MTYAAFGQLLCSTLLGDQDRDPPEPEYLSLRGQVKRFQLPSSPPSRFLMTTVDERGCPSGWKSGQFE